MKRLFTLTLATFFFTVMSLYLVPIQADEPESGSVEVGENTNVIIYGDTWIGGFSFYSPNEDYATITVDHEVYAHHYVTDASVNYSVTFKLQVEEAPTFLDENHGSGIMDEYDIINDAMPQNYIDWGFYSLVDVSGLPRRQGDIPYNATGYTRLDITNPDGDDLNLKATGRWTFVR